MAHSDGASSGECTCFFSAFRVSEQLHQVFSRIQDQPLDQILTTTRQAVSVVHQYSLCPLCSDFSCFPFFTLLLRQVIDCYSAVLQRIASTQRPMDTIELRVGTFSVDAPMGTAIGEVVFSDVRRAMVVTSELGDLLHPESLKGAKEAWDKDACAHQSSIIQTLRNDILKLANPQQVV